MSALPRIGLIAGHGVDAQAWMTSVQLPSDMNWRIIAHADDISPLDLDGLVWLWQPAIPVELLKTERECLQRWCRSIVSSRKNDLIPIMVVAVDSLQSLDEEARQERIDWLQSVRKMIAQVYRHELKSWVPATLVDASRITMQCDSAEGGNRLADALQRQRTTIALWQRRIRRQAEKCLAIGLVLVTLYVTLLLMTVPWAASPKPVERTTEPAAWSRSDWQYHIKDCQQLLLALQGRSLEKLSPAEQLRFNEHLRWLPISYDLLQQKRSTREVIRLRGQVQELLQNMEQQVDAFTNAPPTALVNHLALQSMMKQLLDGVFEPRQPPTMLHQVAQRYWLGERTVTLQSLKEMLSQTKTLPNTLTEIQTLLKDRIEQTENCRVHAPELKTAWLQELSSTQSWIEKALTKPETITIDEIKKESTPSLLREAAGK